MNRELTRREKILLLRGPSWTNLRCIGYAAKCTAE